MAETTLGKKVKQIPEQKLKAFSIGSMGNRTLSKKEIEEQKKREQEKAAAQAFEEYVATFQEAPSKTGKVWIKAGTYDAGRRHEDTKEKGKLYKPQSRLDTEKVSATEKAQEYAKLLSERSKPDRPGKKKERDKKKSNLELFKEELKLIQEEREERHKYKGALKNNLVDPEIVKSASCGAEENVKGSFDSGDPNTTNIYLGNISPKCTEQQLMELFGKHGPLASIKIMWPRSEEEKSRGRNCGFVAFMSRKDGERAMKALNGKDIMGYDMKLGWGKAVHIPSFPIYIPPALLQITQPPSPSGLPFSAQPHPRDKHKVPKMRSNEPYAENPEEQRIVEEILPQALVKVVIPSDRNLLVLIHHMIEFVIREGPMFEAMIMNREINNPLFRFLFDNQNPNHLYYRWKMFSLLQSDSQREWRLSELRMFKGGPIWRPPQPNIFTQGMPDELIERDDDRKGGLSPAQRDRLEQLLRRTTPGRLRVADAMVFCIEHADAADEISDVIVESLSNPNTLLHKKVARLYLISDILHNCGLKITNASVFRRCLESRLPEAFKLVNETLVSLDSRLKAEAFKVRILKIFQAWNDWAIYPRDYLLKLKYTFLGTPVPEVCQPSSSDEAEESENEDSKHEDAEDDLDGVPLDGAALLKTAMLNNKPPMPCDDIDGVPVDDDIDGKPLDDVEDGSKASPSVLFVPSKWETVDPSQIEEQAMTTSKWELLEQREREAREALDRKRKEEDKSSLDDTNEDDSIGSSRDIQEEIRRAKLREIEVKVMQYQDELESGKKNIKSGWTMSEMVEHHRKKLLRKVDKEKEKEKPLEKRKNSPSPDELEPKHKKSRGSLSPPRKSYRSRSPSALRYRSGSRDRRRARSRSSSRSRGGRATPQGVRPSRRLRTPSPDGSPPPPRSRRARTPPSPQHIQRSSKHSSKKHKHKHRH